MSDYCDCSICKQMEETECPICFEVICSEVNTVITECGHKFHCKCLMQNAMHNGFGCPYCRTEMVQKPIVNSNVIENDNVSDYDGDDLYELEEGEIIRSDFGEFVDRQQFHDDMNGISYCLTSFRMFQQRIEGEEIEEEEIEELRERLDMERRDRRNQKNADILVSRIVNNNNITKEDLIQALLYGSFQHEGHHQETYFKVYGKIKGAIIGRNRRDISTRPIIQNPGRVIQEELHT